LSDLIDDDHCRTVIAVSVAKDREFRQLEKPPPARICFSTAARVPFALRQGHTAAIGGDNGCVDIRLEDKTVAGTEVMA
jgi:hypothetical protein